MRALACATAMACDLLVVRSEIAEIPNRPTATNVSKTMSMSVITSAKPDAGDPCLTLGPFWHHRGEGDGVVQGGQGYEWG